jgi:hypothetical protein
MADGFAQPCQLVIGCRPLDGAEIWLLVRRRAAWLDQLCFHRSWTIRTERAAVKDRRSALVSWSKFTAMFHGKSPDPSYDPESRAGALQAAV